MSAHDIDESRLARAVRPEQAKDLAAAHFEADVGQGLEAAEGLGEGVDAQQNAICSLSCSWSCSLSRSRERVGVRVQSWARLRDRRLTPALSPGGGEGVHTLAP